VIALVACDDQAARPASSVQVSTSPAATTEPFIAATTTTTVHAALPLVVTPPDDFVPVLATEGSGTDERRRGEFWHNDASGVWFFVEQYAPPTGLLTSQRIELAPGTVAQVATNGTSVPRLDVDLGGTALTVQGTLTSEQLLNVARSVRVTDGTLDTSAVDSAVDAQLAHSYAGSPFDLSTAALVRYVHPTDGSLELRSLAPDDTRRQIMSVALRERFTVAGTEAFGGAPLGPGFNMLYLSLAEQDVLLAGSLPTARLAELAAFVRPATSAEWSNLQATADIDVIARSAPGVDSGVLLGGSPWAVDMLVADDGRPIGWATPSGGGRRFRGERAPLTASTTGSEVTVVAVTPVDGDVYSLAVQLGGGQRLVLPLREPLGVPGWLMRGYAFSELGPWSAQLLDADGTVIADLAA
jgi:hypothetical protein